MPTDEEFEQLVAAASAYRMEGWDWSALAGRYVETTPPWDYRAAGLEVVEERESARPGHFRDIGAVIMYLRITPWQIADFAVSAYRVRLLALHRRMRAESGLATLVHRFFIIARRPVV